MAEIGDFISFFLHKTTIIRDVLIRYENLILHKSVYKTSMKKYLVMGYQPEKKMIQNIVSVAFFVEELGHCKKYETYPFYQMRKELSSFKSLFMVAKDFKKYTFDILKDDPSFYVVSKRFLALLKNFKIPIVHTIPLIVVDHKNHEKRIEDEYFYIQLHLSPIEEVIDLEQSEFTYDEYDSIEDVLKLKLKENLELDFLIIDEIGVKNQTPICSEEFKKNCEEQKMRGIKYFEISQTPWIIGDTMDNYFAELRGETSLESLKTL